MHDHMNAKKKGIYRFENRMVEILTHSCMSVWSGLMWIREGSAATVSTLGLGSSGFVDDGEFL
jgi:hypothetical protein